MISKLEFVCTANQGRSKPAGLIAQDYLTKIGAADEYEAISSGTNVDEILGGTVPYHVMKGFVEKGVEKGVFGDSDLGLIERAIEESDVDAVRGFYERVSRVFADKEHAYREDMLGILSSEYGIEGILKKGQDQTIPRVDVVAIFPVANRNTDLVRSIYEESGFDPLIETLSAYATGVEGAELPNAFGEGVEFYNSVIDAIRVQVPMAIDRYLREAA